MAKKQDLTLEFTFFEILRDYYIFVNVGDISITKSEDIRDFKNLDVVGTAGSKKYLFFWLEKVQRAETAVHFLPLQCSAVLNRKYLYTSYQARIYDKRGLTDNTSIKVTNADNFRKTKKFSKIMLVMEIAKYLNQKFTIISEILDECIDFIKLLLTHPLLNMVISYSFSNFN